MLRALVPLFLFLAILSSLVACSGAPDPNTARSGRSASGPDETGHPGEVLFEDRVRGKTWTEKATKVPEDLAWATLNGLPQPVVRIEILGTRERLEYHKYGVDGGLLESTVVMPPPAR